MSVKREKGEQRQERKKRRKNLTRDELQFLKSDIASRMTQEAVIAKWGISLSSYRQREREVKMDNPGLIPLKRGRRKPQGQIKDLPKQVFIETARLVLGSVCKLVFFLDNFFPLRASFSGGVSPPIAPGHSLSMTRFRQIARMAFDNPQDQPRRDTGKKGSANKNPALLRNRKHYLDSTIGVHAVEVMWRKNGDIGDRPKRRLIIGAIADRNLYHIGKFEIFPIGEKLNDEVVAKNVVTFIEKAKENVHNYNINTIRLVCQCDKSVKKPTSVTQIELLKQSIRPIKVKLEDFTSRSWRKIAIDEAFPSEEDLINAIQAKTEQVKIILTKKKEEALREIRVPIHYRKLKSRKKRKRVPVIHPDLMQRLRDYADKAGKTEKEILEQFIVSGLESVE